ncbi:GntR family transcriptional regulator [Vagococcus martis]|uniref:GntR family transcriptional regulator n=1 Tax=Vagococcus martis TaxID=1768210 RepID=A0A1V4DFX7_9ENTE|nr:GntR family transcriptional regulator [Vagococcus martis]OPF87427.1 GntR family transcriptional regulator [Vagococcus martis]
MQTKYEKIASTIRERIKNGTYPVDSLLPNQTDLVLEFGVSRMTIKKAIEILMMEGLVYSQRGMGTKILDHSFWDKDVSPIKEYDGLSYQMEKQNKKLESSVIKFDVGFPNKEIQKKLLLKAEQPIYQIIRLRILEGKPFVIEHTIMPCDLVPNLTTDILEKSVYTYLKKGLGLQFGGAYRTFQADRAEEHDKKYLECDDSDPILEVQQVIYLKDGTPIEFSKSRNRYDTRSYSILDVDYS